MTNVIDFFRYAEANPKTTVLGVAAGALTLAAGGLDWKHALLGAVLAAFGAASKDHNVSGGSVLQ